MLQMELASDPRVSRRMIRSHCEPAPGVYGMIDSDGQLIYVGKSKALRNRLLSYLRSSGGDSKARRIIARTQRLVWENCPHEFSALLRELELIRRWRPRYNVRGQPRRLQRSYICVGRGPAAYVYLAANPTSRSEWLFGPVRSRWDEAIRRLNDCFQLRACSDRIAVRFADERELFVRQDAPRCLRHQLGMCLAPCSAGCSSGDYGRRVRGVCEFLRGNDRPLLERLEAEMLAAAATQRFERAAYLRDSWQALVELAGCLRSLREARQRFRFVYPLPELAGGERWYLIDRGHVQAAVPAPRSRRTSRRALRVLEEVYGGEGHGGWPPPAEDPDVLLLVTGWFRRYPEELGRTVAPEEAMARCREW